MVKKFGMVVVLMGLVSCASSGVQQTGKDTYLVSNRAPFSGPSQAKGDALKTANAYCAKQGKHLKLVSESSHECMLHGGCGEAEVTFMCLDEKDPRYSGQP